jgi:hypothetical protein
MDFFGQAHGGGQTPKRPVSEILDRCHGPRHSTGLTPVVASADLTEQDQRDAPVAGSDRFKIPLIRTDPPARNGRGSRHARNPFKLATIEGK